MELFKKNAISPSGIVHAVNGQGLDEVAEYVETLCGCCNERENGEPILEHYWERTNSPVTCKRCLAGIARLDKFDQLEVEVDMYVSCKECALLFCDTCTEESKTCDGFKPGTCLGHLPKDWRNMEYRKGKWYKKIPRR